MLEAKTHVTEEAMPMGVVRLCKLCEMKLRMWGDEHKGTSKRAFSNIVGERLVVFGVL